MDKAEIKYWSGRYDEDASQFDKDTERELGVRFRKNGFATKADIQLVDRWKFEEIMPGRLKRQLNLLTKVSNRSIIETTTRAFAATIEGERLSILRSLKCGIGNAVASAILTFFDPVNYGVFDIHAWRELFGDEEADMNDNRNAVKFFEKLREISKDTGLECRTIEKALFKKNYGN